MRQGGAQNGDETAGKDGHEMTRSHFMFVAPEREGHCPDRLR
jgi:hypothetical protein